MRRNEANSERAPPVRGAQGAERHAIGTSAIPAEAGRQRSPSPQPQRVAHRSNFRRERDAADARGARGSGSAEGARARRRCRSPPGPRGEAQPSTPVPRTWSTTSRMKSLPPARGNRGRPRPSPRTGRRRHGGDARSGRVRPHEHARRHPHPRRRGHGNARGHGDRDRRRSARETATPAAGVWQSPSARRRSRCRVYASTGALDARLLVGPRRAATRARGCERRTTPHLPARRPRIGG